MVPGIKEIIEEYTKRTSSTGVKATTLYQAVKVIQKYKPKFLLECGTGTSTVVLAETLRQLKSKDKGYSPRLISMESISKWHEMAVDLFPSGYSDFVEIRLGEREKFEYSMFRGYRHSNIPKHDYDFVFLDGPNYEDDFGSSCCMDAVYARLESNVPSMYGVADTRVSSVFVMQNIFGIRSMPFYSPLRSCTFKIDQAVKTPRLVSTDFQSSIFGRVMVKPRTFFETD